MADESNTAHDSHIEITLKVASGFLVRRMSCALNLLPAVSLGLAGRPPGPKNALMRSLTYVVVLASAIHAQEPVFEPWTAEGEETLEFVLLRPSARPAPFVLIPGTKEPQQVLARAVVAQGIAVALLENSDRPQVIAAPGTPQAQIRELGFVADSLRLSAALATLRARVEELGFADRFALAATGDGALPVLWEAMMKRAPARAVVLQSCWAPVMSIKDPPSDLPLLVLASEHDGERQRRSLRETAHQAALAGAPVVFALAADPAAVAAQYLADRLLPPPAHDTPALTPARALALARAQSDAADLPETLAWLEQALAGDAALAGTLAADAAFARVRGLPDFKTFMRAHAPTGRLEMCPEHEAGTRMAVRCRFLDAAGAPLVGAEIRAWQTDALGIYAHRQGGGSDSAPAGANDPRLFGYVRTDAAGEFVLHSVRPGGYPATLIPAHVHMQVEHGESSSLVELLFADDPRLTDEFATKMAVKFGFGVVSLDEHGEGTAEFRLPAAR